MFFLYLKLHVKYQSWLLFDTWKLLLVTEQPVNGVQITVMWRLTLLNEMASLIIDGLFTVLCTLAKICIYLDGYLYIGHVRSKILIVYVTCQALSCLE